MPHLRSTNWNCQDYVDLFHRLILKFRHNRFLFNVSILMQFIDRQVVPKRRYGPTIRRCVKSHKNADLVCFAADVSYPARSLHVSKHSTSLLCHFLYKDNTYCHFTFFTPNSSCFRSLKRGQARDYSGTFRSPKFYLNFTVKTNDSLHAGRSVDWSCWRREFPRSSRPGLGLTQPPVQ